MGDAASSIMNATKVTINRSRASGSSLKIMHHPQKPPHRKIASTMKQGMKAYSS